MCALCSRHVVEFMLGIVVFFFFFNDTATTEIYTLSLHDALPICCLKSASICWRYWSSWSCRDRKSTRLNSSHLVISYAVFCLKKKKNSSRIHHWTFWHTVPTTGATRSAEV